MNPKTNTFFFFLTALRHLIGKLMNTRRGKDCLTTQPERRKLSLKGMAITVKDDFSTAIMEVRSQEYILIYWLQDNCSLNVLWTLPFFGIGRKTDLFQSGGQCWVFQSCWHIECSTFTTSSFRIWNSSPGIPSPPLALLVVMLPKAQLTLDSRGWWWTGRPGVLRFMGSQRVRHDWVSELNWVQHFHNIIF